MLRLEPYEGKLSSTVLRGGRGSNATSLPDETKYPYAVAVYPSSERLLAEGRDLWETALARFDECWINDDWPSYPVESLDPATSTSGGPRFEVEVGELEL